VPVEPLALLLLRASRWFDRRLLAALEDAGWPRLTPSQSLVFAHLDAAGVPPATLARRLGTTRQATSELVAGLVRHDLLELVDDPRRRGGRLIQLTATGRQLARQAGEVLDNLERGLGPERGQRLRALLAELGAADGSPCGPADRPSPSPQPPPAPLPALPPSAPADRRTPSGLSPRTR